MASTALKKWLIRIGLGLLILVLAGSALVYWELRSLGLWRPPVYDLQRPELPKLSRPAVLVFSKTNGFIHKEAIPAANALLQKFALDRGWSIYLTENGAIHNAEDLARFDVIVWNNVTGDVLTAEQQQVFKRWLEGGGRWLGLHGTGGDEFSWTWFVETVIGARFVGHTLTPQFARAQLHFENREHPILAGLPASQWWTDELYSFAASPRPAVQVLATLDEASYLQEQLQSSHLKMGDHPVIWWHRVGEGFVVYSALGHLAESYDAPEYRRLLENAMEWLQTTERP